MKWMLFMDLGKAEKSCRCRDNQSHSVHYSRLFFLKCYLGISNHEHVPAGSSRNVDGNWAFLAQTMGHTIARGALCSLGWPHALLRSFWLSGTALSLEGGPAQRAAGSSLNSVHTGNEFTHAKWLISCKGMEFACHGKL